MKEKFFKLYDKVLTSKDIDLAESVLLCVYLNDYSMHGKVITSDTKCAEYLKIHRTHVGEKRKHLEKLGYISCKVNKGKGIIITINPSLIEVLGTKNDN